MPTRSMIFLVPEGWNTSERKREKNAASRFKFHLVWGKKREKLPWFCLGWCRFLGRVMFSALQFR